MSENARQRKVVDEVHTQTFFVNWVGGGENVRECDVEKKDWGNERRERFDGGDERGDVAFWSCDDDDDWGEGVIMFFAKFSS